MEVPSNFEEFDKKIILPEEEAYFHGGSKFSYGSLSLEELLLF